MLTRIIINSGLGNQLFQYSFAHYVLSDDISEGKYSLFNLYHNKNKGKDRPFELHVLAPQCEHIGAIQEGRFYFILSNLLRRVRNKCSFKSPKVLAEFFGREVSEYQFQFAKSVNNIYHGYWQNWRFVERNAEILCKELNSFLDTIENSFNLPENYVAIHIRRGDYIDFSMQFGLLDLAYYQGILERIPHDFEVVVLSDDSKIAGVFLEKIGRGIFFGPESASNWEVIKILREAKVVITANSSLSWWGGFLSMKRGNEVYVPDPWFREYSSIGDAMHHPKFLTEQSIWEEYRTNI